MKFTDESILTGVTILANTHYVAKPFDLTSYESLATDGIIPAGTMIPSNDAEAQGVLLTDVILDENPNGAIVTHGFIVTDKLPEAPTDDAKSALAQVQFV